MPEFISTREGRRLFGLNPEGYADVRPDYPDEIYAFLHAHHALVPNTATLEIGAGSGLATRRLIERGANPITVIEPDSRFTPLLQGLSKTSDAEVRLIQNAFEDADLASASFDLVAAATSFHWLDPSVAIGKIAAVLRPGGYAALWWNVFGDLEREDPFHEAPRPILAELAISPSGAPHTTRLRWIAVRAKRSSRAAESSNRLFTRRRAGRWYSMRPKWVGCTRAFRTSSDYRRHSVWCC